MTLVLATRTLEKSGHHPGEAESRPDAGRAAARISLIVDEVPCRLLLLVMDNGG